MKTTLLSPCVNCIQKDFCAERKPAGGRACPQYIGPAIVDPENLYSAIYAKIHSAPFSKFLRKPGAETRR